jgi:hypothetical protein
MTMGPTFAASGYTLYLYGQQFLQITRGIVSGVWGILRLEFVEGMSSLTDSCQNQVYSHRHTRTSGSVLRVLFKRTAKGCPERRTGFIFQKLDRKMYLSAK